MIALAGFLPRRRWRESGCNVPVTTPLFVVIGVRDRDRRGHVLPALFIRPWSIPG
jgi:hypothetical protein